MARLRRDLLWMAVLLVVLSVQHSVQVKKPKTSVVTNIEDMKEFKKLLRTKTNVLILYVNSPKASHAILDVVKDVADTMKGQATLVSIDCNSDAKKICKKLKIPLDKPYYIKHYKDGDFHKDYDRGETLSAMTNFLRDPTGDLPWEEDPEAADIFHLSDGEALGKFLKRGAVSNKKAMIMFYAPWCGYCKTLKPEYVQAANDLKGEALLAAIDVAKPGNSKVRQLYNITGFPTLMFYEKGQFRFPYNGDNKRQAIVDFIRDPTTYSQTKKKEASDESWSLQTEVLHLTGENFDTVISKAENALVVFYAPWCGHCKRIKPELESAAIRIKEEKTNGILAAVDATKHPDLASRFGVKGYPTLKYFSKGEYKYDASHVRQEEQIVSFMKDPKEPPPPPPPENPWADEASAVRHLDSSNFKTTLRKIKHALVMFYAPWCGHCKSTKPEFVMAAERFSDELMVAFAAVDCTNDAELCQGYEVKGYPTLKYFSYYDKLVKDYTGDRKEEGFVSFIHSQMGSKRAPNKAEKTNQDAGFGPNVVLATDDNFEKLIGSSKPTFVMFYATWCGHCVTAKPAFSRLATKVKSAKMGVQVIALEASENQKAADIAGIQTLPTFKLFLKGKLVADYDGDRSTDDMLTFCKTNNVKDEL
ncbi:protein disulfide-isomerase A5 [Epargyreus clarus]|uniref:protein disulfide-isomerase A5 n=1 Tax=Epargyreus clarus TaxID=520877 RepID=UPI003C2EC962